MKIFTAKDHDMEVVTVVVKARTVTVKIVTVIDYDMEVVIVVGKARTATVKIVTAKDHDMAAVIVSVKDKAHIVTAKIVPSQDRDMAVMIVTDRACTTKIIHYEEVTAMGQVNGEKNKIWLQHIDMVTLQVKRMRVLRG